MLLVFRSRYLIEFQPNLEIFPRLIILMFLVPWRLSVQFFTWISYVESEIENQKFFILEPVYSVKITLVDRTFAESQNIPKTNPNSSGAIETLRANFYRNIMRRTWNRRSTSFHPRARHVNWSNFGLIPKHSKANPNIPRATETLRANFHMDIIRRKWIKYQQVFVPESV